MTTTNMTTTNKRRSTIILDSFISSFRREHSITSSLTKKLKSAEHISRGARQALRDFCNHLKVLNKTALDEEG